MVDVTEDVAAELDLSEDRGALVQEVTAGGPAAKAGLRGPSQAGESGIAAGGDLIVKVDGQEIETSDDVAAAIADNQPGDTVEVEYLRGDERATKQVKLGERPDQSQPQAEQSPEADPFELP